MLKGAHYWSGGIYLLFIENPVKFSEFEHVFQLRISDKRFLLKFDFLTQIADWACIWESFISI